MPRLAEEGLVMKTPATLDATQLSYLKKLFEDEMLPILTPVRCEPDKPLPYSGNMRLHAAFLLDAEEGTEPLGRADVEQIALVQIPSSIDRIVSLPSREKEVAFALLEHLVIMFGSQLFPGFKVKENILFRVTRDADVGVDEDTNEDFVEAMEQVLERREHSSAVRLSVTKSSDRLRDFLTERLELDPAEVYEREEPLNLKHFMKVASTPGFDHLRYPSRRPVDHPAFPQDESIFESMRRGDAVIHRPYQAFDPVIRLVEEAAEDESVLAIKITLYRTSGDSPIIRALERAADRGKQVTALVELKARFDEERNIEWAERLERAGVIVVYGIAELKVHSKALMVIRRGEKGIQRYVQLATGNYNDRTAALYTDLDFLTIKDDIAYEVGLFFNAITGYSAIPALSRLSMAPSTMKDRVLQLIERETSRAKEGVEARIMAKMNALADPDVIEALYRASEAGVEIKLNVRGVCMLVPGVERRSESIRVVSIVDRYLEHSRMMWFRNGGNEELFLSSADWMPRNLERRVELVFPIEDPGLRKRLADVLRTFFRDNTNAHEMRSDGSWQRRSPGPDEEPFNAQDFFYQDALQRIEEAGPKNQKEFSVRRKPPGSAS
jgi:polyphosphate kinase